MLEARLLRKIEHRNVVRFYGVAADEEPVTFFIHQIFLVNDYNGIGKYWRARHLFAQSAK